MINNPILITGVYRSGTTYLSRLLDSHPGLNITYDSVNYFRYNLKKNTNPKNYKEIVTEITTRLENRYEKSLNSDLIIKNLGKFRNITHKDIYSEIMMKYFNNDGKRWGEKTLLEWSNIPTFLSMFEKSQAIHILRDPRDVLASYKNMTIETGDKYLDSIFANLNSFNKAIEYINTLPNNRYKIVIYEDLIDNPEKIAKELCDFLNLEYTKEMLNSDNYKDLSGDKLTISTHSSYGSNDNKKPVNRWKEKLENDEVKLLEAIMENQMKYFNYDVFYKDNDFSWLIETLDGTPLLKERLINYFYTKDGIESYPSDPTVSSSWGGDTGVKGQGASAAYGRK
jgi:hypothetical protein